jgi:hypothetical protein
MAKIHGRYCGPNWTHGRNIPASQYALYPEVDPIDSLDKACQQHDKDCSMGGCSKKGDIRLRNRALAVAAVTSDPALRATALLIAGGMMFTAPRRTR